MKIIRALISVSDKTGIADFARALKTNKDARATWDKLSYTHRREHVEHIEEAKKPETRLRRIEKSIELLSAGKKEPR